MLQGIGPVAYYPKVLKGVVSAGCYACGAFCYWVLVPGHWVLGVALTWSVKSGVAITDTGSPTKAAGIEIRPTR